MNKAELVDAIAAKTGHTKTATNQFLDALIESIQEAVCDGEKVTLSGFGSFERVMRKERPGRNPATGETITIPASYKPLFSVGKAFKDALNG